MNLMHSFTAAQLAHAAGWTLIHFVWQGTLVAIILACVLTLLTGRSAETRYLASCIALFLLTILPIITFTLVIAAEQNSASPFSDGFRFRTADIVRDIANSPEPIPRRIAAAVDNAIPVLVGLWLSGIVLLSFRLGFGLFTIGRMISSATQPKSGELREAASRIALHLKVTIPISLLHSALVQVPTVIGWMRPVILIPVGCFSGLSPDQVEAVLAHELAHIRRHDYFVSVLQASIEAVLFYHPAVWWTSEQIRIEREHCCDDLAVQCTGDALTYARALSLLEERRSALPAIALGANGGALRTRIRRLLGSREKVAAPQVIALTLISLVIFLTGACVTTVARAQTEPMQPQWAQHSPLAVTRGPEDGPGAEPRAKGDPAPAASPQGSDWTQGSSAIPSQYQAWLDQDVRWLILPQQRIAFYQLTSDAERDQFIEEFWQRFDSPGSAPNSYRAEHYRRIAYANQHFAADGLAGWETDRGHMYVVNGAPSSLEAHPSSAPYVHPYEKWGYAGMQLTFVDFCDCGKYQLVAQPSSSSKYEGPVADILSDTQGVEVGPYMKQALQLMRGRWLSSVDTNPPPAAQTQTVIRFAISRDGQIGAMTLIDSAHSIEADRAAWDAVAGVGRFPALPAGFNGSDLVLRVSFRVAQ